VLTTTESGRAAALTAQELPGRPVFFDLALSSRTLRATDQSPGALKGRLQALANTAVAAGAPGVSIAVHRLRHINGFPRVREQAGRGEDRVRSLR
jgi:hypothetical protein